MCGPPATGVVLYTSSFVARRNGQTFISLFHCLFVYLFIDSRCRDYRNAFLPLVFGVVFTNHCVTFSLRRGGLVWVDQDDNSLCNCGQRLWQEQGILPNSLKARHMTANYRIWPWSRPQQLDLQSSVSVAFDSRRGFPVDPLTETTETPWHGWWSCPRL